MNRHNEMTRKKASYLYDAGKREDAFEAAETVSYFGLMSRVANDYLREGTLQRAFDAIERIARQCDSGLWHYPNGNWVDGWLEFQLRRWRLEIDKLVEMCRSELVEPAAKESSLARKILYALDMSLGTPFLDDRFRQWTANGDKELAALAGQALERSFRFDH